MTEQLQLGSWLVTVDREATAQAYRHSSGSDCDCSGCRNFRTARGQSIPEYLLSLFDKLGIDPQKENEVYDLGPVEDESGNLVQYGGWYHFVGSIDQEGGSPIVIDPHWSVWFNEQIALPANAFRYLPLVQLEIDARVPWVLNEPYGQ